MLLCGTPAGQPGRPSKALTLAQAHAILDQAHDSMMGAYVVVSLLTGARTEELRALTWSHVDLFGNPMRRPRCRRTPWCGGRCGRGGDTKTRRSRRTVALPQRCVQALRQLRDRQEVNREQAGDRWVDNDLVFASEVGTRWTRRTCGGGSAGWLRPQG